MDNGQSSHALVYVNDHMPGYTRHREGEAFIYRDEKGKVISSRKTLDRIVNLVIPPMWEAVWICKDPAGHIQATGRDAEGRKQYIYHTLWQSRSNELKYHKLLDFARVLPVIREHIQRDLRRKKWGRERVLALAVTLMDGMYLRVGNKHSVEARETYGLTTLRRKHLRETAEGLTIKYKAKSGKLRRVALTDPRLIRLVKQCSELPGYEVFRYESEGNYIPIDSHEVNAYLREISGEGITAKDFRTWGGTTLAVAMEPLAREICLENPRKKLETALIGLVADRLGNTVSVCRKYYIHPEVLRIALAGELSAFRPGRAGKNTRWYNDDELVVLRILREKEDVSPLELCEVEERE